MKEQILLPVSFRSLVEFSSFEIGIEGILNFCKQIALLQTYFQLFNTI